MDVKIGFHGRGLLSDWGLGGKTEFGAESVEFVGRLSVFGERLVEAVEPGWVFGGRGGGVQGALKGSVDELEVVFGRSDVVSSGEHGRDLLEFVVGAGDFKGGGNGVEFIPGVLIVVDGSLDARDAEGSKADVVGVIEDDGEFVVGGAEFILDGS
ncbi:MAG: hypothetical protein E3J25_11975 [Anaerolineales bacterium]|nr:MAG: hypothetical protein E3J25_11975 [Anaerolineales bacterium]